MVGELDQQFPKGKSKSRGAALVFFGGMMLEVRQLIRAFGGCERCYGKGYGTTMVGIQGAEDFGGESFLETASERVSFCKCSRGQQLKRLWNAAKTI